MSIFERLRGSGVALRQGGRDLRYPALETLTEQVASALAKLGAGPRSVVVVLADRSIEGATAALGVLRAGACYAPLDPRAPTALLSAALARTAPAAMIAAGHGVRRARGLARRGHALPPCLTLEGEAVAQLRLAAAGPRPRRVPGEAAYLIFTSGTTSEPKSVVVSRATLVWLLDWARRRFDLGVDDRVLCLAPLHFDISLVELLLPLSAGARACIAPPLAGTSPQTLLAFMGEERITLCYAVASVVGRLAGLIPPGELRHLRVLIMTGEAPNTADVERLMRRVPNAGVFNLFGSTEVCACTLHELEAPPAAEIPIGRPLPGVTVLLADDGGHELVGPGRGEIWASGPPLLSGYLDASEPGGLLVERGGATFFRTGDWARRDAAGTLWHEGRRDLQLKVMGMRVDLAQIGATLLRCEGVHDAVVVGLPDPEVGHRLRAAVRVADDVSEEQLHGHCERHLESYMLPERITRFARLPSTSTGKLDRRAVAALLADEPGLPRQGGAGLTAPDRARLDRESQTMTGGGRK